MYALRKIQDEFRHNKHVKDEAILSQLTKKAEESLELIKRQV